MSIKKILLSIISFILIFSTLGCASSSIKESTIIKENDTTTLTDKPSTTDIISTTKITPRFKEGYTPNLFSNVSYEELEIVDGLILYTYTLTKSNGDLTVIRELEVDLNKLNIVAGTKNNDSLAFNYSKTTPYAAGIAYTNDTNKEVYATLNADFFGSMCVNAFVKDGYIVKAGHNDNSSYDYRNSNADVPASAPMLFGIKGNTAQIAPIINYEGDITSSQVKKQVIRAKLSYQISSGAKTIESSDSFRLTNTNLYLDTNDMHAIVDVSKGSKEIEVLDVKLSNKVQQLDSLEDGKAYLYCSNTNNDGQAFLNSLGIGKKISLSIKSPDGLWNDYETILGCRQALIINGEIPSTVALENSNGAQSNDVPRSAVGINVDNKVCIYAIESMYYGRKNIDSDSHGCDINLLAEFMYYNNIVNGANFDGGGSTQLICKVNGESKVFVRSSDTGSTDPKETRLVMNVIMVTEK